MPVEHTIRRQIIAWPQAVYIPIMRALRAFRCAVVTSEIPSEALEGMGLEHFLRLEEALDHYSRSMPQATANVFSAGGMTVPVFPPGFNPNTLFETYSSKESP